MSKKNSFSVRCYDLILSCLFQKTSQLFIYIYVFKGKINSHLITDIITICVRTRQIREFSTFNVNNTLRHVPSARYIIASNDMRILFCKFLEEILSYLKTLSRFEKMFRLIILVFLMFPALCV